jgi:DNA-binding transcriptional regulator YdaS (Cro superfamily)
MSKKILQKAIDLAGSQSELARRLRTDRPDTKIAQRHISKWLTMGKEPVPPAEWVIPICRAIEWQITPHELRQDLYPEPGDGVPFVFRGVAA